MLVHHRGSAVQTVFANNSFLCPCAVQTGQPHAMGSKLHIAAYEALNDIIRHCGDDCNAMVGHLVGVVLQRLASTMQMEKNDAL